MPTLPLYVTPAHPDAWHQVIAPGGYEWWRLEAENSSGLQIAIDFFDGDILNDAYRRAFARYRANPTRITPPVPRDYPAARISIGGVAIIDPEPFSGSLDQPAISVEPHTLCVEDDDTIQLSIVGFPAAELSFQPAGPVNRTWETVRQEGPIAHFNLTGLPSYTVSGTIQLEGSAEVPFSGKGTYSHRFGTGPLELK